MKIALIDPVGAKMGMNHYNNGLMNAFSEKYFSAFILSNYTCPFEKVQSKVFFHNINKPRIKAAWNKFSGMIQSLFFCRKQKMNFVIFHIFRGGMFDLFSLALSKLLGLKILLIVHDIETIDTSSNKFIKRIVLTYFHDIMIVHNKYSLEKIKEFTGKRSVKNIFIIPHGNYSHLPEQIFTRNEAIQYFHLEPSQRYLLFFGQIKKTKGLDVLLEALALSKSNFHLIIAGKLRIKNFNYYQKIIDRHNLKDRVFLLLRFISDEEAGKLFSLCEAVILPYKMIYQSGVLLLSMNHGKTIIGSDLEPFKEIIQHGVNGLLFEKDKPHALAELLNQVSESKIDLVEIGMMAKVFAEKNYSWNDIAASYENLLFKKNNGIIE